MRACSCLTMLPIMNVSATSHFSPLLPLKLFRCYCAPRMCHRPPRPYASKPVRSPVPAARTYRREMKASVQKNMNIINYSQLSLQCLSPHLFSFDYSRRSGGGGALFSLHRLHTLLRYLLMRAQYRTN